MLDLDRQSTKQAYQQELLQHRFTGLSTEKKPTTGADGKPLLAGCTFEAVDTARRYWWDGYLWSAVETTADRQEALLVEQNRLLRSVIQGLELMTDTQLTDDGGTDD